MRNAKDLQEGPSKASSRGYPYGNNSNSKINPDETSKLPFPSRVDLFFQDLGPGLITECADDDPSGISTCAIAGAAFGYATLWTALISFPLMVGV